MHRLTNARYLTALFTVGLIAAGTLASAGSASAPASQQTVWVISGVTVGVPRAPDNGGSWDTAIIGILTFNLKNIQPDVRMCMESAHVPARCTAICENAAWSEESHAYVCAQPTGPAGLLFEKHLHVVVEEIDPGSKRVVADFTVDDPAECTPCTLPTPGGTLWVQFDFAAVTSYTGPFRATLGRIPPPSTLPVATPSSGGSAPSSPGQTPTAAEVEQALGDLRDADHCIGPDNYFPQGTVATRFNPMLQGTDSDQYYQMAAFAMAVSDPTAHQLLLANIRSKVGDDTYNGVMTLILGDVAQSQALLAAFQDVVKYFSNEIVSRGLAQFLRSFQPATSLTPDVKRWILKKLTTDKLASRAVDLMFTDRKISAECAFNQLAKEGFIETIGAR